MDPLKLCKKILVKFIVLLLFLILPSSVFATWVDCTPIMAPAEPVCATGNQVGGIYYYSCSGGDKPTCKSLAYGGICGGTDHNDNGHYCDHPTTPTGYYSKTQCEANCQVSCGWQNKQGTCTPDGCDWKSEHPCVKLWKPCWYQEYGCTPPVAGGSDQIGAGACCGYHFVPPGDNPPCTCPEPSCTVTDAMCATSNFNNINYKTTKTGDLCLGIPASCQDTNTCGNLQTCNQSDCYHIETNNSVPDVTSIKIYERLGINNFEWTTYQPLSSTRRTVIRYPYKTSEIRTETNNPGIPSTARGLRVTLNGILRTLNVDNPFNSFINIPTTAPSLNPGNQGTLSSFFETLNKCDDNWVKGTTKSVNFVVNTPPTVISTTVTGNTAGNTAKGCTPEARYTGNEANRTLTFKIVGRDINTNLAAEQDDANHRINAAVLWLVKEGSTIDNERNTLTGVGPGATLSDPNKIGIMVNTMGGIYKSHNGNGFEGWGRDVPQNSNIQQPYIYVNNNGKRTKIATITLESVKNAQNPTDTTDMTIKIEFEKDSPISGKYNIWAGMMDNLTLFPTRPYGYFADIRSVKKTAETWNFDFQKPTLKNVSLNAHPSGDQRRLVLRWTSEDNILGGIRANHTVVNVYKGGQVDASEVYRVDVDPSIGFTPIKTEVLDSDKIGDLPDRMESGWLYEGTSGNRELTSSIGDNAEGKLYYYITIYDNACNYTQSGEDGTGGQETVELDKWIVSKGGIFFSKGDIRFPTKIDLPYNFANLGTELISSGSNSIEKVNEYTSNPLVNPAVARLTADINSSGSLALFNKLVENFEGIRPSLGTATRTIRSVSPYVLRLDCNNPLGCVWEGTEVVSKGAILEYTGNIIIVPPEGEKDIYIRGDVVDMSSDSKHSLFIFTEGSVNIGGSVSTNEHVVIEDQIDAFIIAKENINILPETVDGYYHDRVTVEGGLIAFGLGEASSPAFSLQRSLGLHNQIHPVLSITYHPKYAVSSGLFFGLQNNAYKREVGFKPG